AGTLVLTGNNSAFNGTMLVDSGGTLSGRSTTLMSAITDNGLVQFNQTSNGTYAGVISGTGAVQKIGGGTLTLSPGNTYSGGTFIDVGTVSVGADSALGAATGGVTIDGGTLQFASAFDLATTRSVTIGSAGGTIDTNGNNTAIAQTIGGAGTLTKIGAGDLTLNGANTYAGGTNLNAGTITIGNNLALGPGALAMANGTTLSFVSGSNFSVANPISIAGTGNFTPPAGATDTLTGAISDGASAGALNMSGAGTLVLTAANTYSGGTTIGPGTLQLGDGGASGSIIGNVTDNGTLAFDRSDTMTFSGLISGTGGVNQIGSGTTVLDNNETYTGATDIIAGTLIVGDPGTPTAALSGGGLVTVDPGATLGGFGSIAGSVVNNGTLAVGNALSAYASAPMTNFIIGGDYSGSGTLMLNTVLNAGGALSNQSTDRLLIIGNASGTTSVLVNATGSGAYTSTNLPTNDTGISIIQVAGTASPNAFTLPGGYVSGGTPYQYHLNEYGPSSPYGAADPGQNLVGNTATYTDYRLQAVYVTPTGPVTPGTSTLPPDARLETAPQVPSYITAPTALFNAGFEDLDELHRRLGEIRDAQVNGQPQSVEIFVHGYGNTFNYTSNRSFADYGFNSNQNYAAAQMGGSGILIDNNAGTLRVGAAGSYGELWFNPMALDGQSNALFDSERLYGIATYQSRSGWYLDGIVAGGHFSGNVDTTTRGLAGKLGGTDVAASLEGGYLIPIGWENVFVEPEVQAVYQHLNFNGFTDVDGVIANLGSPNQGIVRAGGRLLRPIAVLDGRFVTPYVEVNLLQGFGDGSAINLSGANFATGQYGTAVQVRGGLSGMLSSNIAIFGDVAWQHQISDGGFRGWAFNAGLRHDF
ncbi:MAG TPA: autotransporter outer membrane beta-barrel domain-containing protein, partial [Gemmataceae bacterium]|nr:autotransporter outer membrane beta-barrel domain-containing protein [Gemmataceae bacterium]